MKGQEGSYRLLENGESVATAQESLLCRMLEEQRKTNALLAMLIDAMGESEADPDAEPAVYMDGTPVR